MTRRWNGDESVFSDLESEVIAEVHVGLTRIIRGDRDPEHYCEHLIRDPGIVVFLVNVYLHTVIEVFIIASSENVIKVRMCGNDAFDAQLLFLNELGQLVI